MFGIGNDPLGQLDLGQDQGQGFDAGDRLVGRILTAEYMLGINTRNRVGQQLAGQSLGQLIGLALGRVFR